MEINKNLKETLRWEKEGSGTLEIELENNIITKVMLCENGKDSTSCITCIQEQHLRNINAILTETFAYKDKQLGKFTEEIKIEN